MKKTGIILALLLITVCAFTQAPDWQWATQAGGSFNDRGYEITIDDAGNSYVTGRFWETATFGSYSLTSSGSWDIFVAKMDTGGYWQWATRAGGTHIDYGFGITTDNAGNSYVTGRFWETATFGSYSLTSNGNRDIFVAKVDAYGVWQWATHAGGTYEDNGKAITIDDTGNSYVTGIFTGTATFGSYSLTSNGWDDIFVAKMDANGNWLWATQAGGIDYDSGYGITIYDAGNSYVTGWFRETATFGSYSLTSSGLRDIFVAKMDSNGNWLWATRAGGVFYDWGYGITIDNTGNSYVTGIFTGTATFGSYSLTSNGWDDIFVAKIDANGNWLWATKAGGTSYDMGYGIAIDDAGNIYVTGCFEDTATFGLYSLTSSGYFDIFVAKLNSSVFAENEIIPLEMRLSNYPNPFNPSTTISFETTSLHQGYARQANLHENARIEIYNLKGQKIKSFPIYQFTNSPVHQITWNGTDESSKPVSSGIYFYKLRSGDIEISKKMLLLK
ncbi:MAG: SBBP repeat-containing protein [Candidatus Cloacimonetes bacterium]|nr:SBBP repeat-containing protein [Candidatus Cloacimonadota bacterium]